MKKRVWAFVLAGLTALTSVGLLTGCGKAVDGSGAGVVKGAASDPNTFNIAEYIELLFNGGDTVKDGEISGSVRVMVTDPDDAMPIDPNTPKMSDYFTADQLPEYVDPNAVVDWMNLVSFADVTCSLDPEASVGDQSFYGASCADKLTIIIKWTHDTTVREGIAKAGKALGKQVDMSDWKYQLSIGEEMQKRNIQVETTAPPQPSNIDLFGLLKQHNSFVFTTDRNHKIKFELRSEVFEQDGFTFSVRKMNFDRPYVRVYNTANDDEELYIYFSVPDPAKVGDTVHITPDTYELKLSQEASKNNPRLKALADELQLFKGMDVRVDQVVDREVIFPGFYG